MCANAQTSFRTSGLIARQLEIESLRGRSKSAHPSFQLSPFTLRRTLIHEDGPPKTSKNTRAPRGADRRIIGGPLNEDFASIQKPDGNQ